MKRLVLLVEGEYDGDPICNLINTIIQERCPDAFGELFVDSNTLRVGNVPKLSGQNGSPKWLKYLQVALQRKEVGGIITVIDGDENNFEGQPFCAATVARTLTNRALQVGAGVTFSLAVVILRQEFESLLIAASDQLPEFNQATLPDDIEESPRGAKGWLNQNLSSGYKPQHDQLRLTQVVSDWSPVRTRMRCFRRLEHAVLELVQAVTAGQLVATPATPSPDPKQ